MWTRLLVSSLAIALIAAGCGDDDDGTAAGTTSDAAADTSDAAADTSDTTDGGSDAGSDAGLQLSSTDLGQILVDEAGNTVYLFMPDEQGEPTCNDACEENWPAVGELDTVGEGLDPDLLGTVERADGDIQATYNDWPLYTFANDAAPGDINGQGINDVWYVIDAEGNPVQET